MSVPVVALDIGSTKVACAIGLPHDRASGFELLGTSLVAYPSPTEHWPDDLLMISRTVEQAIEATAVKGDFHRALVAFHHPALVSEPIQAAVPLGDEPVPVRAHDLQRLQAAALDRALGVDRDALLIERLGCDGNGFTGVRDPRGLPATRLLGSFHLISMPLALRRALIQVVESAGLEVARLTHTLPAAFAGVTDEAAQEQHLLVIDIGGSSTDAGRFVDGQLQAAVIQPWGGMTLARELAKERAVTMDQGSRWILEGSACRQPGVKEMVAQRWTSLHEAVERLLAGQPRPHAALVTGRGALIDGFVEWIERETGIPTSLGRSGRVSGAGDLSRQVALSPAIGMLDLATRASSRAGLGRSPRLINRLIERTRTILTEYF
jgi:cell division protein FtsA